MRIRLTMATGALLLASATFAAAQQIPWTPTSPVIPGAGADTAGAWTGSVDIGGRFDNSTGDVARYERYRDLRDGATTLIGFGKRTSEYLFDFTADNIGYHDQRYIASYSSGKAKVNGFWDSVPLNYSYLTSTPWVETSTGVFSLDVAARTAVQNKVPGVVGVPQNVASLATPSIYRGLAKPFDLLSRRDAAGAVFSYDATSEIGLNFSVTSTKKGGQQPFGMSFSFNNANELAMPLDNRTNDVSAGLEWSNHGGMIRVGWDASWFNNNIKSIIY